MCLTYFVESKVEKNFTLYYLITSFSQSVVFVLFMEDKLILRAVD